MIDVKQIDNDYTYLESTTTATTVTNTLTTLYTFTTGALQGGTYKIDFNSLCQMSSVSNDDAQIWVTLGTGLAGTNTDIFPSDGTNQMRIEYADPNLQRVPTSLSRDFTLPAGINTINIEAQRAGNGGILSMFYVSIRLVKVN